MKIDHITYRRTERYSHFDGHDLPAKPIVTVYAEARVTLEPGEVAHPSLRRREFSWLHITFDLTDDGVWRHDVTSAQVAHLRRDGTRNGKDSWVGLYPYGDSETIERIAAEIAPSLVNPWEGSA